MQSGAALHGANWSTLVQKNPMDFRPCSTRGDLIVYSQDSIMKIEPVHQYNGSVNEMQLLQSYRDQQQCDQILTAVWHKSRRARTIHAYLVTWNWERSTPQHQCHYLTPAKELLFVASGPHP